MVDYRSVPLKAVTHLPSRHVPLQPKQKRPCCCAKTAVKKRLDITRLRDKVFTTQHPGDPHRPKRSGDPPSQFTCKTSWCGFLSSLVNLSAKTNRPICIKSCSFNIKIKDADLLKDLPTTFWTLLRYSQTFGKFPTGAHAGGAIMYHGILSLRSTILGIYRS